MQILWYRRVHRWISLGLRFQEVSLSRNPGHPILTVLAKGRICTGKRRRVWTAEEYLETFQIRIRAANILSHQLQEFQGLTIETYGKSSINGSCTYKTGDWWLVEVIVKTSTSSSPPSGRKT